MHDKRGAFVHPCEILLVEDNPADAALVTMALAEGRMVHVCHVDDGREALDVLYQRGEHENSPRPEVVLLDLNLPLVSGHEVLRQMKADDHLASIPVIVFSSSSSPSEIKGCYRDGANAYMIKPASLDAIFKAVALCRDYWLDAVVLPSRAEPL